MAVSFDEFCKALAHTVTFSLIGEDVIISSEEFNKILEDLKVELRQAYLDKESPYGETEEDMVRYLMENTQIEIEGEDS